jgi:cation diffusion facilitator CzcD-associated flavoprotein CzcO
MEMLMADPQTNSRPRRRVAIIGAGFSGICVAIHLRKSALYDFTLFEKAESIGGTWRDNAYPGAVCDVPSISYSYSFAMKLDWSRKWSPQSEILAYIEDCAHKYDVYRQIHFSTEIQHAEFDNERSVWVLTTAHGAVHEADILITGTGQLNRPLIPDIPGLESFEGPKFHSARWDHSVELAKKRIAVIGSAASAVQLVPEVAREAARVSVLQRTPNWIMPMGNRKYSETEIQRRKDHPWRTRFYRWLTYLSFEARWPLFKGNRFLQKSAEKFVLRHLEETIRDPMLRDALTPDYPLGSRRLLTSDHFLPALNRENVDLVTDRIDHIEAGGVVTANGRKIPADVLVLATGFRSTEFLAPMEIVGRNGKTLQDAWSHGAEAYLGLTVSNFPNFFMMYGPNTNLGHNSIIFMIECQTAYIMDCLRKMDEENLCRLDLKQDVMQRFNAKIQKELEHTVFAQAERSWYKTAAGKITNNWSTTTVRYWLQTRRVNLADYIVSRDNT